MSATTVLAQDTLSNPRNTASIIEITEIAGLDIANQVAQNWDYDAQLIWIGISKSSLSEYNHGTFILAATGWAYVYRSDSGYLRVLIDVEDYTNNTARSEELDRTGAEEKGFGEMTPLVDYWAVVSLNALKIASEDYCMSLGRGDAVYSQYLCMEDMKGISKPVWHISIRHGTSGIITDYLIDALTGDILERAGPTSCSSNDNGNNEDNREDKPANETSTTRSDVIITGIFAIVAAIIGALIGLIPWIKRKKSQKKP